MRTAGLLLGFALAFATGACAVHPAVAPDAPVELPDAFTATGFAELPDRWWTAFDDPALTALVDEALTSNLELKTAWDRLAQFEAIARREGAARAVQADATGGAELGAARSDAGGRRATRSDNTLALGVAASYEIDAFGRLEAAQGAALLDAAAQEDLVHATAVTLSALVATTYFTLAEARLQLEVIDGQIATNEQVLDLATARFRQGQVGAADVLRQRQLLEATRAERIAVEAQAAVARHQLAVLLGRPPAAAADVAATGLPPVPPLPETGVPAALVDRRPDVRAAYVAILSADRRVAAAIADRYPRFSLSAIATTSAERASDLFSLWFASIALDAVAPLLDGGARAAEVDRTRAVVSERIHAYGDAVLNALREVEDALVRERKQAELLASLDAQLELSDAAVARLRERYTKGGVAYVDVLQAVDGNQELARRRVTARRTLLEFRIDLYRALAGRFSLDRPVPVSVAAPRPAGTDR